MILGISLLLSIGCRSEDGSILKWVDIMTLWNYSDKVIYYVKWLGQVIKWDDYVIISGFIFFMIF